MHKKATQAKKSLVHGGDAARMKGVMSSFQAAQTNRLAGLGGSAKLGLLNAAQGLALKKRQEAEEEVGTRFKISNDVVRFMATGGMVGFHPLTCSSCVGWFSHIAPLFCFVPCGQDDAMRTFTGDVFQQAAWCTMGLLGYIFNKLVCVYGHLPNDCIADRGVLTVHDIQVRLLGSPLSRDLRAAV